MVTWRGWRVREIILHICLISKVIPLVIFRWLPVSEILGQSRNTQSCGADFCHVDNPSSFQLLHENIHATRVITLSAEELGTISKNNLRGICLFFFSPHLELVYKMFGQSRHTCSPRNLLTSYYHKKKDY